MDDEYACSSPNGTSHQPVSNSPMPTVDPAHHKVRVHGTGAAAAVTAPHVQGRVGDPPARRQQFDDGQDDGASEGVHAGNDVGEDTAGQHDGGPAAVPPLPDGAGEETEKQGPPTTG